MKKIYLPAKYFKVFSLLCSFFIFSTSLRAATITSTAAGGNWNVGATWVGGTVPGAGDDVTIVSTATVTVNVASNAKSLVVAGSLIVNSDLTIASKGSVNINANGAISFNSTAILGGGGSGANAVSFTMSNTSSLTTANAAGITSSASAGSIQVTGTRNYGTNNNFSYNGSASQITGDGLPSTVNALTINNATGTGVSLTAAVTVTTLNIGTSTANSIFNDNGKQVTSTGTFNLTSGTFNVGTGATATTYPSFGTNNIASGTTVNYNSTAAQTIRAVNYANLSSVTAPRIFANSGTIGISGTFTPGTGAYTIATSTVSFNGTATQSIPAFTFNNLVINNTAGISSIGGDITVNGSLALTNGVVTTGTNKIIMPSGSASRTNGWINGNLQQYISSTTPINFYVGSATVFRPVLINFSVLSTAGSLTVSQLAGFHPQIANSGLDNTTPKAITPYWKLTAPGSLAGTYDATFSFVSGDVPGSANTNNFVIRRYSNPWFTTITGSKTATSTQATGLTSFGEFAIGEISGVPAITTPPSNVAVCLGTNASITSASTSTPSPTVQWERSTDGGSTWTTINGTTDGGVYTAYTTNTLGISSPGVSLSGYKYRSVYTNINGSGNSNAVTLTVTQIPTITLLDYAGSPFANITSTPQAVTLNGTNAYTGGTFSSDAGLSINSTTGAITPNTSTVGNHTVTYTIAAAGGCGQVTASTVINITTAPTATISYPAYAFCSTDNSTYAATLTGTGNYNNGGAGFYTVSPTSGLLIDASTGAITPNGIAGTYTITYHIPATGGFPASTSDVNVVITALPTATITYTGGPFCSSDQTANSVAFSGTSGAYTGGTFSSSPSGLVLNSSTGAFTPYGSTATNYTITYTIPASAGCPAVAVNAASFDIVAVATASISYNSGKPYCQAITTPQPVTLTGASGGSFSSSPSGLTIDASGNITPSSSATGTYTVTYTIPASGPCGTVQITTSVTISETPTGNISYPLQPYCTSDPAKPVSFISPTGLYTGGVFSSTSGLTIDANTGTITPSTSTPSTYIVTYTTPNGCSVTSTTPVEIVGSPTATISYANAPFCATDNSSRPVTIVGDQSGSFSPVSGLSIDPTTGSITPGTSTPGTYTVTYTITPASANCAAVTKTTSVTITPAVGVPTAITIAGGTEPTCQLANGTTTTTYATTATNSTGFNWSLSNAAAGSISSAGVMTWANGFSGTVDIQVTANGCNGLSAQVIRTVTITPTVGTPTAITVDGGTEPTCQITAATPTTTYGSTATNSTGFNWSVSNAAAGSINSLGVMTWANGFSGSVNIQVTASGCNGPSAQVVRTVAITPAVGTPVFSLGATSTRCQGAGSVTYTASATNSTGIAYSLDATSAAAGNTIVAGTGVVTFVAGWSGTSTITASATGCSGPVTSTHVVTITPTVSITAFSPATSTRCQGAGSVTITTTALNNSAAIVYSLDAASIAGGNSINSSTGAVTFAATWSGTTTITASAAGCNGPATTTHVITINATSVGGTVSSNQIICQNATPANFALSGNTGSVVKWQKASDPSFTSPVDISGTSGLTTLPGTTIGALSTTTYFRAVVQNGSCSSVFSGVAYAAVNPPFTPTLTATPATICLGQSSVLATAGFNTADTILGGDFASPTNILSGGWLGTNGNASNNNTYINIPWGYTNSGHDYGSPSATFSSNSSIGTSFMIVSGNVTSTLTTPVFSTVGRTALSLQWYQGYVFTGTSTGAIDISINGGATWTNLATYNSSSPAVSTNNPFTSNGIKSINLDSYLGQPNVKIRFVYTGGAGSGSTWALDDVNVVGPYQPISYTWTGPGLSASGSSVTVTPTATGTNTYTIQTTTGGCTPTTTTISVTVNPVASVTAMTATACSGSGFTAAPVNGTNGVVPASTTYSWSAPTVTGGMTGGAAGSGTAVTGTLSNLTTNTQTATYTVTPLTGSCTGATFTVTVTVTPAPKITTQPISQTPCVNSTVSLTVQTTNAIGFQWYKNGSAIAGATAATYTIPKVSLTDNGNYYVVLTGTAPCTTLQSNTVSITSSVSSTTTWTSGTHTVDWDVDGNWSCGVPTPTVDAIIPEIAADPYPTVKPAVIGYVRNLTIQSGIATDPTVTVQGALQHFGNISNGGIYNATGGSIEFNGNTITQTISSSVSTATYDVKDMTINTTLVNLTTPLNLYGKLKFAGDGRTFQTNDGNLTMKSNGSTTAMVTDVTNNGVNSSNQVTGNVIAERSISSTYVRRWRLVTAPVTGTNINAAWQEGKTWAGGAVEASTGYGTLISGGSTMTSAAMANSLGYDYVTPSVTASIRTYQGSSTPTTNLDAFWVPLVSGTKNVGFDSYNAYLLFVRGDRSVTTGTGGGTTLRGKGVLREQPSMYSLSVPVSATNSYTLIGNPFASPISFASIYNDAANSGKIKPYFWIYMSSLNTVGGYALVQPNGSGGYEAIPYYLNNAGSAMAGSPIISSGEGFFVVPNTTSNTTITIKQTHKTTGSPLSSVLRQQDNPSSKISKLYLNMNTDVAGTNTLVDGALVQYPGTIEPEKTDIIKALNGGENLSINKEGRDLIVSSIGTPRTSDTIQLRFWNSKQRNYRFEIKNSNFSPNISAFLLDKYLDKRTPIDLGSAVTAYDFSITGETGSNNPLRFAIVFGKTQASLPLVISDIKAFEKVVGTVAIEWQVNDEQGIRAYTVERSVDGQRFQLLEQVTPRSGAGPQTYQSLDLSPSVVNYYRVKMVGNSGEVKYSDIVKVELRSAKAAVQVYPNPTENGHVQLQFINKPAGKYLITVFSNAGQQVLQKSIQYVGGTAVHALNLSEKLASGSYNIELRSADGKKETLILQIAR